MNTISSGEIKTNDKDKNFKISSIFESCFCRLIMIIFLNVKENKYIINNNIFI